MVNSSPINFFPPKNRADSLAFGSFVRSAHVMGDIDDVEYYKADGYHGFKIVNYWNHKISLLEIFTCSKFGNDVNVSHIARVPSLRNEL